MSRLLGTVARGTTGESVEERPGWIERHGRRAGWCARLAAGVWRGAGLVDGDGDDHAGEEALVELPRRAIDVERAVAADASPDACGERDREGGLVDRARGRARPRVAGQLAEQTGVRRAVVVLIEEREQTRLDVVQ